MVVILTSILSDYLAATGRNIWQWCKEYLAAVILGVKISKAYLIILLAVLADGRRVVR